MTFAGHARDEASYEVNEADWTIPADRDGCSYVRRSVFVIEQELSETEEWDESDTQCRHILARDSRGEPIATARLLTDGSIGRVAVIPAWRGQRVGEAVMRAAIDLATSEGRTETTVHAQVRAVSFYERLGYYVYGELFWEAGIPHRYMRLVLREEPPG